MKHLFRFGKKRKYRSHKGRLLIDLHLRQINQLFNSMDPSPFLERDLDDDAADFILSAAQEHSLSTPLGLVISFAEPEREDLKTSVLVESVHNHFAYEAELARRRLREVFRQSQIALLLGFLILAGGLTLAYSIPEHSFMFRIIKEGLIIISWVALWRPLDILLYSWWPLLERYRQLGKLSEFPIEVHYTIQHEVQYEAQHESQIEAHQDKQSEKAKVVSNANPNKK